MSGNTQRFSGKVEAYDRYRERYPADAVLGLLREWCGLRPEWTVADVGAGTGMLSEVFLQDGNRVIAIEPNDDMRQACEVLQEKWPRLEVLHATAESMELADASVEMVSAGRAFHWFNVPLALAEFRRVLKPDGWVVLASLRRAHVDTEQAHDFERVLTEFGTDPTFSRDRFRVQDDSDELFPRELHRAEIPGEHRLDWETMQGFAQSLSMSPAPGAATYEAFDAALREHFDKYAHDGVLAIPTTCKVSAGRL
jgi:ubiquinone/menaquinone biosynthesis C-methylase UbiE